MVALPVISLEGQSSEALANRLLQAGQEPGFFYLTGHGIAPSLIAKLFGLSRNFFQTSTDDERVRFASRGSGQPGFSGSQTEKLSGAGQGDLKESYHFESFSCAPEVTLPDALASNRKVLRDFSDECERVGNNLLSAFSIGLKKSPEFLAKHHTGQQNRFRILHYLPAELDSSSKSGTDIRAGAHSDYGSLTLLFQEPNDEGGLQVWRDGSWTDVPYRDGAIVINIGDALEFWTAGQLRSTIHRVTFPRSQQPAQSRYSIPFFITADDETMLEPMVPESDVSSKQDIGMGLLEDIARVKGYVSLDPITAQEHRIRREEIIGGKTSNALPIAV